MAQRPSAFQVEQKVRAEIEKQLGQYALDDDERRNLTDKLYHDMHELYSRAGFWGWRRGRCSEENFAPAYVGAYMQYRAVIEMPFDQIRNRLLALADELKAEAGRM